MAKHNDLGIRLTGVLNLGATVGSINKDIKAIEKSMNKLQLKVDIDPKVMTTLNTFNKQMLRLKDSAFNAGKVIDEVINADGSKTKRTYFSGLAGEFSQVTEEGKKAAKSNKEQAKSLDEITEGFNKATRARTRYNAAGKEMGSQETFTDGTTTRTVSTNAKGTVTGYTDVTNIEQAEKATQKLTKSKDDLLSRIKILNTEGKLNNENTRIFGELVKESNNPKQLEDYKRSLNEVVKGEQVVSKEVKQQIADKQSRIKLEKDYEQVWLKGLKEKELKEQSVLNKQKEQNRELRQQVATYKQIKQQEAQRFMSKHGGSLNETQTRQMNSYIQSLQRLDATMPQVERRMKNMDVAFKNIRSSIDTTTKTTIGFGQAMSTAMVNFAV